MLKLTAPIEEGYVLPCGERFSQREQNRGYSEEDRCNNSKKS